MTDTSFDGIEEADDLSGVNPKSKIVRLSAHDGVQNPKSKT
ncbi:hypothetical protein ACE1AT_27840 [Pelatocladus sp. BLCC-F211]